jgi:hypothetical protein
VRSGRASWMRKLPASPKLDVVFATALSLRVPTAAEAEGVMRIRGAVYTSESAALHGRTSFEVASGQNPMLGVAQSAAPLSQAGSSCF